MKILFITVSAVLLCFGNTYGQEDMPSIDSEAVQEEVSSVYDENEPTKPEETEFYEPAVPVVQKNENGIPNDAVVLFNGKSLSNWENAKDHKEAKWDLNSDGSMTVKNKTGDIQTKQKFGDIQLHIEWQSPAVIQDKGQHRANSGIFLSGKYEVQVLDNNENATYVNGQVGSIYKQHVPLAMASVPSGEWNVYDIVYHAPEFDEAGLKIQSETLTVMYNGILIQDHVEIIGTAPYIGWPKNPVHGKGSIMLQDHGDNSRVSYRNI